MLFAGVATAMVIDADNIYPIQWEDWIKLPVREQDEAIHSPRLTIRAPTVVIAVNFAKVPLRRPSFSAKAIRERDGHRCQYTGKLLKPEEGNLDHVLPRSRGGKTSWENCVLASKEVNSSKAAKLPAEAGLRLLRPPKAPPAVPAMALIRNSHRIKDWDLFLRS